MKKKRKISPAGIVYYKRKGLTKNITLFLSKDMHKKLKEIAEFEERPVQAVTRRALEEYIGKNWPKVFKT